MRIYSPPRGGGGGGGVGGGGRLPPGRGGRGRERRVVSPSYSTHYPPTYDARRSPSLHCSRLVTIVVPVPSHPVPAPVCECSIHDHRVCPVDNNASSVVAVQSTPRSVLDVYLSRSLARPAAVFLWRSIGPLAMPDARLYFYGNYIQ